MIELFSKHPDAAAMAYVTAGLFMYVFNKDIRNMFKRLRKS